MLHKNQTALVLTILAWRDRRVGSRRLPQNRHDMNAPLSWNAPHMIKLLN